MKRYTIEEPVKDKDGQRKNGYRVTDTEGDNRVATCYDYSNAQTVCSALNKYVEPNLFNTIEMATREGFTVSLRIEILQLVVKLSISESFISAKTLSIEQMIPISGHFYESKIIDVIQYIKLQLINRRR